MIIKNESKELINALNLDQNSLKHIGNFVFEATKNGKSVIIYTKPIDEEFEYVTVNKVLEQ